MQSKLIGSADYINRWITTLRSLLWFAGVPLWTFTPTCYYSFLFLTNSD